MYTFTCFLGTKETASVSSSRRDTRTNRIGQSWTRLRGKLETRFEPSIDVSEETFLA